jgi:hypothetical protein
VPALPTRNICKNHEINKGFTTDVAAKVQVLMATFERVKAAA